ncbi:MAG TPA: glycine C-acetyltransferase [Planctomycetota bacterium]|jgi:glycine C-acetyltransferase|nr:glycine C-acetyltransferase [Planctomycetota bacterium]OQC19951.1 MAG: 2-amino-3-ketobutyrate coenzyme A ligase [Planctomycetes bacterium ADurb.Bin069]HNR99496.1 glycine C-acetyltransferase [Planctomycetota bacterium]HNU27371.1 glycine C-acetyltransferase [Planctomycetota bacterium]HOE30502.1 glycine C-acetyltransferase [Planctomycetota bacterium]
MNARLQEVIGEELAALKRAGTYKELRYLDSPMAPSVEMEGRGRVLVFSSNNYLGLSDHSEVRTAGVEGIARFGAGTASVRFICGTFTVHRDLEEALARLVGCEAALTYVSCWTANEGLIPTLAGPEDAIISDALNHASIIDGCRLAKNAERRVYPHADMASLAAHLKDLRGKRRRLILTDGVFSMEGDVAPLPDLVDLAEKHDAVLVVDDSHGTGVMGETGRGTAEHFGLLGKIDIITSTLGKALGGAAGGFVASSREVVDYLVQKSRPQLFSNALPPTVAASALAAVEVLTNDPGRVARLRENVQKVRSRLAALGFTMLASPTAIIPIIVGDTARAIAMSDALLEKGIFVTGFGFPVVPEGAARLRIQVSAAHTDADIERLAEALAEVSRS